MPDLTAITTAQRERIAAALASIQQSNRLLVAMTGQAAYSVKANHPDAAAILERIVGEYERIGEEVEKLKRGTIWLGTHLRKWL